MQRSLASVLVRALAALLLGAMFAAAARADEDGYQLWLRYRPLPAAQAAAVPASAIVTLAPETPTVLAARTELQRALGGMLGRVPQAWWCS